MSIHNTIDVAQEQRVPFEFSEELITLSEPLGAGAEYIRALRTHVLGRHMEAGRRALAICEPAPGLGATFVAANLAISLAQAGVKTLLIDANLRAPSIQHIIKPDRELIGLRQCLTSIDIASGPFLQDDVLPNLSVMFAGGAAVNAQELLAQTSFDEIITSYMRDFAMTIIDTPPANSCADALRIAAVAGYSLIVTRRNRGLVSDLKILAGQLKSSGSAVIGGVLNNG
jgi:capsular exopolysaccharide synthesis family protein